MTTAMWISKWLFDRFYRVDNILRDFNKAIKRLEKAKKYHEQNQAFEAETIRLASLKRDAAEREAARSDAVAEKLRVLVGL